MSWLRLDDSFMDHPKFLDLEASALRVWLRVLCHCNRHRTRGYCSNSVLVKLGCTPKVRAALLSVPDGYGFGLWEDQVGGISVHDYGRYQPAGKETTDELSATRAESGRAGGLASGESRRAKNADSLVVTKQNEIEATKQPTEAPSRPVPSQPNPTKETPPSDDGTLVCVDLCPPVLDQVRDIFAVWSSEHHARHPRGRPPVLDVARRKAIEKALRTYDVDRLKLAVTGIWRTPYNLGQNERGTEYTDVSLALRDAAHIERFAAAAVSPPASRPNGVLSSLQKARPSGPGWDEAKSEPVPEGTTTPLFFPSGAVRQ